MNVIPLWLIDANDVSIVGGKANALGEMLRAGFKVPNGFVLPAAAFNDMTSELEQNLLKLFDELGATFVAVRSSAINEDGLDAAWAGQLDTFLNCSRDELLQMIKRCWESVNTERAKSYAQQKGIESASVAVIVQEMIESEVSGVAFSAHPITGSKEQVVVEAGFGLGEAIVSGQITPDTYIMNKQDGQLLEKHLGAQKRKLVRGADGDNVWKDVVSGDTQKLTEKQMVDICGLARELEDYFKYPIDIEWAIHLDTVYVLQCRPITT